MANNHMGDLQHGIDIIKSYSKFIKMFPQFEFIFKFQMRDINTFIHKDFITDTNNKYVSRFKQTELTIDQFNILKAQAMQCGFATMCTPFDQKSVERVCKLDYDYLKIASCSFTDWSLLTKISQDWKKSIVASVGGVQLYDIDRVIEFFVHRNKNISLMHCVGKYPTQYKDLQLNQIKLLKQRYPFVDIGFSSHQIPSQSDSIMMAIAMGANIFERHICVETQKYGRNAYSMNVDDTQNWLKKASYANYMCGVSGVRNEFSPEEIKDISQFKRGAYFCHDVNKGDIISRKDVYYAFPAKSNQVLSNDMSKYNKYKILKDCKKHDGLCITESIEYNNRDLILSIVEKIRQFVKINNIRIPENINLQISHHFGIHNFYETGLVMFTIVNEQYCKKTLITLPKQRHPQHYHKEKKQTFIIIYGQVQMTIDDKIIIMKQGDIITVYPNQRHKWYSETGCVIEQISSTHYSNDSFYTQKLNSDRKTFVTYWREIVKDKGV